jgi:lipopolysaccharide biosynthesis protein
VYRIGLFPDIRKTVQTWRAECRAQGIGEIYLAMVESFELSHAGVAPQEFGFDACVEFPPHESGQFRVEPQHVLNPQFRGHVFDYCRTVLQYMTRPQPGYTRFRTVMPGWDNTARRQDDPDIFTGSTPDAYQAWLEWVLRQTREQQFGDERIVFVNAWNEWAEGTYLEPDLRWGHLYLEATRNALDSVQLGLR